MSQVVPFYKATKRGTCVAAVEQSGDEGGAEGVKGEAGGEERRGDDTSASGGKANGGTEGVKNEAGI